MDPLVVSLGVDRLVRFFALGSMLEVPLLGAAMKAFGVLPGYPELGSEPAVQKSVRILSRGGVVGIFPEGHRSKYRLMGPVRRGVGRLSIVTGAPVVPVTIDGTYEAWPTGVHTPRPYRIKVTYHEPISPTGGDDAASHQALADRIAGVCRSAQEAQEKQRRFGSDARRGPRTGY